MALESPARIHQQREPRRVTFRKNVLAEALDLLENGFDKRLVVAARPHAIDDAAIVPFHAVIARRRRSTSPGMKPAAKVATSITYC
jgi:hypothetical protein